MFYENYYERHVSHVKQETPIFLSYFIVAI